MRIELHFREGFSGEMLCILINTRKSDCFELKTRVQTGLAKIVPLDWSTEDTLILEISASGIRKKLNETTEGFFLIDLKNGQLHVRHSNEQPGYL